MKVKSRIFYWYAALVIAYLLLSLLPAPDHASLAKYHLTPTSARLLDLTIVIPVLFIWFVAFYGYQRLYRYAALIRSDKDGKQLFRISRGLLILAIGLPLSSILSAIMAVIAAHNPGFKPASVVISNYYGMVYPLLAFIMISIGARGLGNLAKTRPRLIVLNVVALVVIMLGVGFCSLVALAHTGLRRTYHMSPELVMLTLGIPYMYTWFLGLFAVAELHAYSSKVAGTLYLKGWSRLLAGFTSIIFIYILLEYLSTLSTWLNSLSLGWLLVLLYVLLILLAAAFIVVALGAQKLTKIEEA